MSRLETIKRLYYRASPDTIHRDLAQAIALLKSMRTEEERERAAVFMDGLSQMRSEWALQATRGPRAPSRRRAQKKR